jgi:NAD(P)-dependent dehydrogenase (short-subunit alcohol dehydrogenase family)
MLGCRGRVAVIMAANGGVCRAVCNRLIAVGAEKLFAFDIDPVETFAREASSRCPRDRRHDRLWEVHAVEAAFARIDARLAA